MARFSLFLLIAGLVASANSQFQWPQSGTGFGSSGGTFGSSGGTFGSSGGTFGQPGGTFGTQGGTFGQPGGTFGTQGGTFGQPGGFNWQGLPSPQQPGPILGSQLIQDAVDLYNDGLEISPGLYVKPHIELNPLELGVGIRWEFKRSVSQPTKAAAFSLLDIDGNGSLSIEEWHAHKGGVVNFALFLDNVDDDENEEVSWGEFQDITRVYTNGSK